MQKIKVIRIVFKRYNSVENLDKIALTRKYFLFFAF